VKLGEEFLMSSLFTVAEIGLARLALAEVRGAGLDVVVAGLRLGYTARAVLHPSQAAFYTTAGLRPRPSSAPGRRVRAVVGRSMRCRVQCRAETQVVTFVNPLTGRTSANTVYVAR
jgi:hypothetical protein